MKRVVMSVMLAIAVGCIALPLSLHHIAVARIREANLDAIRFAAASPEQLRALPVVGWREGSQVTTPTIAKRGWEQYQMVIPHGDISTIIDIDLRSTMLPLLLGVGGWLRIVLMVVVSGVVTYFLLKYCCGWRVTMLRRVTPDGDPISASSRAPWLNHNGESTMAMPANGVLRRQDPSQQTILLYAILHHIPNPAFYFDHHHQLAHWNAAAQAAIPHLTLATGIHVLDLSAHLPWGNAMVEKMDEVAEQSALIIHKGESLCVIPG